MYIAIYGPPGAGKSTIIREAIQMGLVAFDLEEGGETHEDRIEALYTFIENESEVLFGAADIAPEEFPEGTKFVLLLPSKEDLLRNVEMRGDKRDHKWKERALEVRGEHANMADEGVFDLVLTENLPPEQTVAEIIALLE